MAYSGKYIPKNTKKYEGDSTKIVYRSLWERGLMKWCDNNPDVVKWSSEEIVIPYISPIDNKAHRYFMDFKIVFKNGTTLLVEVKPKHQTQLPINKKNKRKKKLLNEMKTYAVNDAKWQAADKFAKKRGWEFTIFTEDTLKDLGVIIPNYSNRYTKKKKA